MDYEKRLFGDTSIKTFVEAILDRTFERVRHGRECPVLSDRDFVRMNVTRIIQEQISGRDFLQKQEETSDLRCDLHAYFRALHSERRLAMLEEFANEFRVTAHRVASAEGVDYLGDFPELKDRQVIAADGHYHAHACHAERTPSGKLIQAGSIYQLDMHTGILSPMTITQTDAKKHHEIKALRKHLRTLNADTAEKPIVVYDPAIIDKRFFLEMKRASRGVEIITRMNLLRLILKLFEAKFQITEEKLVKKRQVWLEQRKERARLKHGRLHPFVESAHHMYQLSAQFIRAVRNHLFNPKTIRQLLPVFRERMQVYLGAKT